MKELAGALIVATGILLVPIVFGKYPWLPVLLILIGGSLITVQRYGKKSREAELDRLRARGRDAGAINIAALGIRDD
ncbi:MAG: hypothetical protein ACREV9_04235 [Burkholderiales bacterium]